MILTHAQIRNLVSSPDQLAQLMASPEEREELRQMGVQPFLDYVMAAYVAGTDLDTSASDLDRAAVKALAQGQLEQAQEEFDAFQERIEGLE